MFRHGVDLETLISFLTLDLEAWPCLSLSECVCTRMCVFSGNHPLGIVHGHSLSGQDLVHQPSGSQVGASGFLEQVNLPFLDLFLIAH